MTPSRKSYNEERGYVTRLTPNTHHEVREALLGATVVDVIQHVERGRPDRLRLRLHTGQTVVIEGEPLNLRFGRGEER